MVMIFLGAPGSGKGTISSQLVKNYGWKHISTGDIFRSMIKDGGELGLKLKSILDAGQLVDDKLTNLVMLEGIKSFDLHNENIIFDGYPRNLTQATYFDNFLEKHNVEKLAVLLDVDNNLIIQRLSNRLVCPMCGKTYHKLNLKPKVEWVCDNDGAELIRRNDDEPEKIQERLSIYENQTQPLVGHYELRNELKKVDGSGEISKIVSDVLEVTNVK